MLVMTSHPRPGAITRQVHRIDISSQESIDAYGYRLKHALDHGVDNDFAWFTDGRGRLGAALASDGDETVLFYRNGDDFVRVPDFADSGFVPMRLAADGATLIGYTDEGRDQRDLVELDPATGRILRTLHSRRGVDVQGALFDPTSRLLGATYFEDGLLVADYLDEDSAHHYNSLRKAFPDRAVAIIDRDAGSRRFIVMVSGSDLPTDIYHYDSESKRAYLLEHTRPWFAKHRFVPAELLEVKSSDGLEIEAYLTLPPQAEGERAPLVVLPHGGPIGVRDTRSFDPEVQFLAALGYAVLQVNFRGSEGFGVAFRDAAERKFGTRIEDDVDAALTQALKTFPLDPDRMCMVGSSYGGYSALVAAMRWPGRFRCVVSIAGVTDQILFFTASDGGRVEEGREQLERAIGNPHRDADAMIAVSPLYHTERLDLPVMLAHGTEDLRVDEEHTRRLVRMLNLQGKVPTVMIFEGAGHGFSEEADIVRLWRGVAGFLRAHLAPQSDPPRTVARGTD
jgi:dipeptidyl aminopeptidase/acylaminoacyl peptidase